tara:strand:+ start:887 stop:4426 length:3540 start_codon:yes stop_codon:yes gene_type:complete
MVQGIDLSNILNTEESEQATGIDLSNILVGTDTDDQSFALDDTLIVPESGGGSEFVKGLRRGFNNMQALTGDAIQVAGELLGKEGLEKYGAGVSAKNRLEAANVGAPIVPRVEDVKVGNLSSFVSNSIGEALPSFIPALTGAAGLNVALNFIPYVGPALKLIKGGKLAVSALGAYLPSSFLSTGEGASEQKQMAGTTSTPDPMQALFTGLKAGALDALTVIPIIKAFKMKGGTVSGPREIEQLFGVTKDAAKKIISSVPGIIRSGTTAAIIEGPTEAAQESIFIKDAEKVTGQKMNKEEYESRLLNAFVQGTIGGGAIGTGARVAGNLINNETVDERIKINDLDEGTVVKYPDFKTFQKEGKPEDKQMIMERYKAVFPDGINNKTDFLKLQTAEMEHIVDKPLHKTMREIYAKGGKPFAANYYGKGAEFVRYDMPGREFSQTELVDTGRFFKLKKGAKEVGGIILDKTIGKSIGAIADLSRYSPTLTKVIQDFEYFDDPVAKTIAQDASLSEAITLKTGEFDRITRKAEQQASKFFRAPFTSKVTPKINSEVYSYITNPAGYQGSAKGKALGKAYAKEFQAIYDYAKEAKFERGGTGFEGTNIPFDPGFIENYFPIMLHYKKFQSSRAFREQFKTVLKNNGVQDPDGTIQAIIGNDGLTNLSETVGMDPAKKAGNLEYERKLKEIPFDQLAPFINTNTFDVLRKYRDSIVRRVEYAKRFGMNNEILQARIKEGGAEVERKRGEPLTETEKNRFFDLGRAMQKQYKPIDSAIGRKINSALITYGYILTLPFATISSISEPFLVLSRGGAGPKVILKSIFSGVKGIFRSTFPRFPRDEYDNAVMDIGIGMDAATTERLTAAFGGGQETNRFTEKFFRLNFLSQFTRWNRLLAAAAGRNMIMSHARFLSKAMEQKGVTNVNELANTGRFKKYQEQLRELGIEPQLAVDFMRSDAVRKNNKKVYEQDAFYQNQIRLGSLRYVNEVVMNPRAASRPMWMSDPHLAIFGQLKGFQIAFSNTVLKRWYNEMFRSGFYNGMENGAKYAAVGALMVVAAALGNELREFIQYGPEGNKRYKDESEEKKLFRALERTGFLGPLQFLLDSARAEKFGSGPVEALMGPIVTRLVSYLEGVADLMSKGEKEKLIRELVKSIPVLGSTPLIRNRLYEALGVESTFGQKKSDFAM